MNRLVIYGIGAPTNPDNGDLPDAPILMSAGVDIAVPDYIGFGRSKGTFTPSNCIKTFLYTFDYFKNIYPEIIVVGRSLGGSYAPILPKYNHLINKVILIYPAVNQSAQGEFSGEEDNSWFVNKLVTGFNGLYHGATKKVWADHVLEKDNLSPMNNVKYLANTKVFIGHGKKDLCINSSKSLNYWRKIIQTFPHNLNNYKIALYPNGDHGPSTSQKTIKDALAWFGW